MSRAVINSKVLDFKYYLNALDWASSPAGLHQSLGPVERQARRQKLWEQRHGRLPHLEQHGRLPSVEQQGRLPPLPSSHTKTRRAAREAEGISINLGVKRILIEDPLGDMLNIRPRSVILLSWGNISLVV